MEEKEQPLLICAFFAGLEEAMDVGPRALAQHLNHYRRDIFTNLGRESARPFSDSGKILTELPNQIYYYHPITSFPAF